MLPNFSYNVSGHDIISRYLYEPCVWHKGTNKQLSRRLEQDSLIANYEEYDEY